jgi:TerC family integral membrane protein
VPVWFEVVTYVVIGLLLVVDLVVVGRRPHTPPLRESASWVGFYAGLALLFAVALGIAADTDTAASFLAGWLTEYSLSVDNLFVFVVIFGRFAVPRDYQQKVLFIGILLSLVLRGGFILVGAEIINRFSWVFYIFGAFLVYTAVQLVRGGHSPDESDYRENIAIRTARRLLPMEPVYDGARLTTVVGDRRRRLTPMVLVFVAIGTTDLLFALDSIPAIFGLTTDPFIVFTATLFALMGLRQLYFLLGGLLDRLIYLSAGLAVVLGFIGVKLIIDALHENEVPFVNDGEPVGWAFETPTWLSLVVVVATLAITTVASLAVSRRRAAAIHRS